MPLQDAGVVLEAVEVGHIVCGHISPGERCEMSPGEGEEGDSPVSVQELECMVPKFLGHLAGVQSVISRMAFKYIIYIL